MFITLFIVYNAKKCKQHKSPAKDEMINKLVHLYNEIIFSNKQECITDTHATTWMSLKCISEVKEGILKRLYMLWSHLYNTWKRQYFKVGNWSVVTSYYAWGRCWLQRGWREFWKAVKFFHILIIMVIT